MTGIELITKERKEQIEKHGYIVATDLKNNSGQLVDVAKLLLNDKLTSFRKPDNWVFEKMISKSTKERLIIAGALIAAEIDRLNSIEQ